jgi:ketosteroid isomerase-like protein
LAAILIFFLLIGGSACTGDLKQVATAKDSHPAKLIANEEFESLKKRVQMLEDKDAITSILSRYSLNVDLGRGEDFLKLFVDDCVFASDLSGSGKMSYRRGKKELGEMVATPPPKGQHLQLDYHINVNGDTAVAYGYQDLTSLKGTGVTLGRAAIRYLKFKRIEGTWLIQEVYTIGIDNETEYIKVLPDHM